MKNQSPKKSKKIVKFIVFILLVILLAVLIKINYTDAQKKIALENTIADMTSLNSKQTFSIDKIYLYSSANATNNKTKKSMWNLNVYQYTDIALYISGNSNNKAQNTIKELYIDNIKFDSFNGGTPNLHYKNLFEFGKFNLETDYLIADRLNYEIVEPAKMDSKFNTLDNSINVEIPNTVDDVEINNTNVDSSNNVNDTSSVSSVKNLDYAKPQVYSDLSNPITLEYMNLIKSNYLVSDIENPLVYNGSLLKRAGVDLTSISGNITFKVHIKNILGESYVANVKIAIPLKDDVSGDTIYDGSFTKEITTKTNFSVEK